MKTILEQLDALAPLAAAATEGPWRLEQGRYDTLKETSIHEIARRDGGGHVLAAKPYRMAHKANAAFIVAARNFLTPETIAALRAAPAAPVTESREGEVLRPVYAPGGVLVTADEILKGLELALDRSYKMEGDKAYNYLYSTGQYATQVLRKMLAAAPVVESRPADADTWFRSGDNECLLLGHENGLGLRVEFSKGLGGGH